MIIPRRRRRDSFLPLVQLLADIGVIYGTLWFVFWVRFASGLLASQLGVADYPIYYRSFLFMVVVTVLCLRFYGLYRPARLMTFADESVRVVKAVLWSTLILTALTFFVRGFTFSRSYLVTVGFSLAAAISVMRFLLGMGVMWVDQRRGSPRNILVVGCDENAKKLVRFYRKNPRFSTHVSIFLDDETPKGALVEGVPVEGRVSDLTEIIDEHKDIHEVVLASPGLPHETILRIILECEKRLLAFRLIADIFGLIASKMSVTYLGGTPVLSFTDSPLADWENRFLKRASDVVIASAALFFLSPFFLVIAALVRMSSPGPILYRQERIGENGSRFPLYKFRTMRVGAEKQSGPVWAKENDLRRTAIGTFLRKNNLDELPQLWNVLRGDMSLVGPRPERPFFVSQFKEDIPRYMARHSIRSGITGWAQVHGLRGNTSIEERTKYDLFYIENWSLVLDLKIILMTIFTFFRSRNAY